MSRVASLGMYDHPAQAAANDRLWSAVASDLRASGVDRVPATLDRTRPLPDIWRDPDLLLAQACGYPLVKDPALALRVVALPRYAAPGCDGDTHGSFVVCRRDDDRPLGGFGGSRAAINAGDSNTGLNLFRAAIAGVAGGKPFFAHVVTTGSHHASLRAVVRHEADIAAVDAVTHAALARFEPALTTAVRIVAPTPVSPTLPFVTARATDAGTVAALRHALARAIADPALAEARAALFLTGVTPGGEDRLDVLRRFERDAALAGYPELC